MGQCIGKNPKEGKYIVQASPLKTKRNHPPPEDPLETSCDLPLPQTHPHDAEKENLDCNLELNFQSTVEIKRRPTDESERKATLKSGIRSSRTAENEPIDERVARLMAKDPLMGSIFLRVRQNLKRS
jgi:hypothetical protein